jgi:thioredoxin-related protein
MNTLKSTLLLSGALTLAALAADEVQIDGAKAGHWTMDYDAAVKTATEKKLPIIVNFTGSDWCGWCKIMDKNVFAEDDWKKFAAENAMLVTIDFPKDEEIVPKKYKERNEALKGEFKVSGYPTYIILDSDGKSVLGRLSAGKEKTPSTFIKEFEGVVRMSDANIAAYIKANPDKAKAYQAAIDETRDARKALKDWIVTKPERNEENTKLFEGFNERIKTADEKLAGFE